MSLFSKKAVSESPAQNVPTVPTEYPDGIVVVTESGRWYIKGRNKYQVPTDRVFTSWSFPLVVKGTDASVSRYAKAGKIGFRSGSFLYNDGKYYFVSGNVLRKISSPDVFLTMGLDTRKALWVSDDELKLHKNGEVI